MPDILSPDKNPEKPLSVDRDSIQIWRWPVTRKTARLIRAALALPALGVAGWLLQNFLQLRGIVNLLASQIDLAFLAISLIVAVCAVTIGFRHKRAWRITMGVLIVGGALAVDWLAPKPTKAQSGNPSKAASLTVAPSRVIFQTSPPVIPNEIYNFRLSNNSDKDVYVAEFDFTVDDPSVSVRDFALDIPARSRKPFGGIDGQPLMDMLGLLCHDRAGHPLYVLSIQKLTPHESREVQRRVHSSRISRPRICAGPDDVSRGADSGCGEGSFSSRQV